MRPKGWNWKMPMAEKERSTEKALWEARVVVVIRTRWMTMIYCDNKWPPCEGYCPNRND